MCFKEMNRHFTIEDIQMSNKPIKILSTSLAMSKMLVQTTMRFHYTPIRTAKIISDITKCCQDVKLNHLCCWEVCKLTQPPGKKQEKQTYHSTQNHRLLGTCSGELNTICSSKNVYTNRNCSFICNSQVVDTSL